jgi:hypothetical protein
MTAQDTTLSNPDYQHGYEEGWEHARFQVEQAFEKLRRFGVEIEAQESAESADVDDPEEFERGFLVGFHDAEWAANILASAFRADPVKRGFRYAEPSEREAVAGRIDPSTAEIWWIYAYTLDPYDELDLSDEERQVGREWFAADPDERVAVHVLDLDPSKRQALEDPSKRQAFKRRDQ